MRLSIFLSALLLVVVSSVAIGKPISDTSKSLSYLFVINAQSGSFDGKRLYLKAAPKIIYFSNRPYRIVGEVKLNQFVKAWGKGSDNFKVDPPNAFLSMLDQKVGKHAVLELSNPQIKGVFISYNVRVLKGKLSNNFGAASLFIDMIDPEFGLRPAR